MTVQTLKLLRDERHAIESLQERIERLRAAMEMTGAVLSHTPKGSGAEHDRMATGVAKLEELASEYSERLAAYMDRVNEVEAWVDTLPEGERAVMRARYVDGLGWRRVAARAGYSVDHCFTIHRRALKDNSQ